MVTVLWSTRSMLNVLSYYPMPEELAIHHSRLYRVVHQNASSN